MIGRLSGQLVAVRADTVILDVMGVGYEITMSPKAIAAMPVTRQQASSLGISDMSTSPARIAFMRSGLSAALCPQ